MKKGIVFATALLIFSSGGVCWGWTGMSDMGLGVELDATWVSKYIWRGFDRLDNKSAFQPSVSVDLFKSGFSVTTWASYPGSSQGGGAFSTVNRTEYNYIVTYANSVFVGEAYQMDFAANWIYYDFIDNATRTADYQEANISVAFPQILGIGVVPNYTAAVIWPTKSNSNSDVQGWFHQFGVVYNLPVDQIYPNPYVHSLALSWDMTYNDGAGAISTVIGKKPVPVDHDWSHTTWGLSTEIDVPYIGGKFRPGIYYQLTMDESVNRDNEFWTGLSYAVEF